MQLAKSLESLIQKTNQARNDESTAKAYRKAIEKIIEDLYYMKRDKSYLDMGDMFDEPASHEQFNIQKNVMMWNSVAEKLQSEGFEINEFSVDEEDFSCTITLKK